VVATISRPTSKARRSQSRVSYRQRRYFRCLARFAAADLSDVIPAVPLGLATNIPASVAVANLSDDCTANSTLAFALYRCTCVRPAARRGQRRGGHAGRDPASGHILRSIAPGRVPEGARVRVGPEPGALLAGANGGHRDRPRGPPETDRQSIREDHGADDSR
jgi:hypothetical protein